MPEWNHRFVCYQLPVSIQQVVAQLFPQTPLDLVDEAAALTWLQAPPRPGKAASTLLLYEPGATLVTALQQPQMQSQMHPAIEWVMLSHSDANGKLYAELFPGRVCLLPCHPESLRYMLLLTVAQSPSLDTGSRMIAPALLLDSTKKCLRMLEAPPSGCEEEEGVYLTDKEMQLLLLLIRAEGRFVSNDTLIAEIWQYHETVSSNTLAMHIYRLRRKLGPYGGCILSGDGYCWAVLSLSE